MCLLSKGRRPAKLRFLLRQFRGDVVQVGLLSYSIMTFICVNESIQL